MSRRNGHRPAPRQIATGDLCLWPRCPVRTSPGRVMDPGHWRRVPPRLRDAYTDAKTEHGAGSRQAGDALAAINEWARRQVLAAQEASA